MTKPAEDTYLKKQTFSNLLPALHNINI